MKLPKIQERRRLWEGSIRETFYVDSQQGGCMGWGKGGGGWTGSSLLLARTADMDQLAYS